MRNIILITILTIAGLSGYSSKSDEILNYEFRNEALLLKNKEIIKIQYKITLYVCDSYKYSTIKGSGSIINSRVHDITKYSLREAASHSENIVQIKDRYQSNRTEFIKLENGLKKIGLCVKNISIK